ncbi:MAG: aminotransferase class I/II-fold pyridoxal phosphate-dependent enzyme [Candidatus Rokubacteria bacterium]|nr:aminotransferase class I/II-fold pyridoxal phosphate-dependent enzyme [Candidatus Rokubacteria bacterium]
MHDVVDLRSDTLTTPTPEMRAAMAAAEVGDDVWEEDPTVKRLEAMAAERLGKEAALFVASGTMGNQVAVMTHTRPGQEVIVDADAHIYMFEVGGIARLSLCQVRPLPTERGLPSPEQVRQAIRPSNIHVPPTGLLCLENTHNRHSGSAFTPEEVTAAARVAREHGVPVHLDGARIFNAAVALRRDASEFCREVDSVQFCLSKGLAAPVGSLVVGTRGFIAEARRNRKLLGGGMRQVGVLAAAGIVALERMVDRLAEDHANAKRLAEGISRMPGIRVDLSRIQTNIVIFHVDRPGGVQELVEGCRARKVKLHAIGPAAIRCVTHKDVDAEDIERALAAIEEVVAAWA